MKHGSSIRVACRALLAAFLCTYFSPTQEKSVYRNSNLPVEQRVADPLSRMTLEEKVAQLGGTLQNRNFLTMPLSFSKDGLGEMSRPSEKNRLEPWN
jgi:hypothetical protein